MIDKEKFPLDKKHLDENAPRCEGKERSGHGHCGDPRERFAFFYEHASVNDKLMINLRYMNHAMRSQFEQKAGQKRILIMLSEQGTLTQRELTEQLGIRPGSASEILAKLDNAGLITRAQNGADRRTVDVSLTEAGAALAAESAEKRSMQREDMFSCLTAEEQATLLSLLEKIHADWETRFPVHHGPHGPHGPFGKFGPRGPHGPFDGFGPRGECGRHCGKPHGEKPNEE